MQGNRSIKSFILTVSFIFSFLGFFIIYWASSQAYYSAVKSNAIEVSGHLADTTFNAMFQVMRQGWTRKQLDSFIDSLQDMNEDNHIQIQIYRGKAVEALYGKIDQADIDSITQKTLDGMGDQYKMQDIQLRHSVPLVARDECLGCHTNVNTGDVLGAIQIRQDLSPLMARAQDQLLIHLIYMVPFPLLLSMFVIYFLNRRINQSIDHLEEQLESVSKVADLSRLELQSTDLGFTDLNRIFCKVERLAHRMKDIAVDRDLLEFEIKLLEKFVITSEVVRDWREYINTLLSDINSVMTAYNLFSIFKVDDELFALDIFWYGPPEKETKLLMEEEIRKALDESPIFHNVSSLEINHAVANSKAPKVELNIKLIRLHTRSLFLEAPKIGGIVGIGVHSEIVQDESRQLVMESVLSTLINVVGSVRAIHKYTKDLEYYATRDPLTDLLNQRLFWEMLNYEVLRAERHDYKFGLLVIDLDNFKTVNDAYGHSFGDAFLQELAEILRKSTRTGDLLARYGGDEFTVILPENDMAQIKAVADRILEGLTNTELRTPPGDRVEISVSIGMAIYPEHAGNSKDLFMFADNMMHKAKSQGKDRIYIPTEEDVIEIFKDITKKSLVISKAIKDGRIVPYFQPLMGTVSGEYEAVEVLSRLQMEDGQLMAADEFIQIAENMGVIHILDFGVMEKAFERINKEAFKGLIFINMSPRSLVISEFILTVTKIVAAADIDPQRVVFEITERDTVKNLTLLQKFVFHLKEQGFQLAIDDFGSGFSSFHYLKHFPIDFVKIEGEFIANMTNDATDYAVVRCISGLAHELNVRTIGEYVESQEILDAVTGMNITYVQGFHVRPPEPYIYAADS